jgi:hypothetical protein
MSRAQSQFKIELLHEAGKPINLALLADALLLLHTDSSLDTALQLAHDLNATSFQQRVHNRALNTAADALRVRLAQIEDRLRHVA